MKAQYKILSLLLLAIPLWYAAAFVDRSDHLILFSIYSVSFLMYIYILYKKGDSEIDNIDVISISILALSFLVFDPFLSEDINRFAWDGHLIVSGINPYEFLPNEINDQVNPFIFEQLNSPDYYSVYPPLKQLLFAVSAFLSFGNTDVQLKILQLFPILAIPFIILVLRKLLSALGIPEGRILILVLNPLFLLECCVNAHFESIQLVFILLTLLYLMKSDTIRAAIFLGLACSIKLLPLIVIPLVIRYLGWKKGLQFAGITLGICFLGFLPFLERDIFLHVFQSIDLYFTRFEFNASMYYLFRSIGYWVKGYNMISIIGPALAIITLLIILSISWYQRKGEFREFLHRIPLLFVVYFIFATTVHPWYIITILGLSLWWQSKVVIWWTFIVFFSYHAYKESWVSESLMWTYVSYLLLILFWGIEKWYKLKTSKI
jgi:alpha-1,6-mannosyltransferase